MEGLGEDPWASRGGAVEGRGVRGGPGCGQDSWPAAGAALVRVRKPRGEGNRPNSSGRGLLGPHQGLQGGQSRAPTLSAPGRGCLMRLMADGLMYLGPHQPSLRRKQETAPLPAHIISPHSPGALGQAGQLRAPQKACGSGGGGVGRAPLCRAHTQPRRPTGTVGPPPWPRTSSPQRPAGRQGAGHRCPDSCFHPFTQAGPSLSGERHPRPGSWCGHLCACQVLSPLPAALQAPRLSRRPA